MHSEIVIEESHRMIRGIHHIAVICSIYAISKDFYSRILGIRIIREHYRTERKSYKLDLALDDGCQIELFSFPAPPPRVSRPEACGLRHLAFRVSSLEPQVEKLRCQGVAVEDIRIDEFTGKRFVFFSDPDGLPIELYED